MLCCRERVVAVTWLLFQATGCKPQADLVLKPAFIDLGGVWEWFRSDVQERERERWA